MASYNLYYQGFPPPPQSQSAPTFHPATNHTWPNGPVQAYRPPQETQPSGLDIYLKILNPACKKEGEVRVLCGISMDTVDSPDLLKRIMASQYGDQLPDHEQMEIGYFHKTNKICIKSRLDVNDVWGLIRKGEKVTLWCVGASSKGQPESHKRPASEEPGHSAKKVKKGLSAEEKRAAALEFEETTYKAPRQVFPLPDSILG